MSDNSIEDLEDQNIEIEESAGSDTLKPMGGSGGGESRAVQLATFTNLLAQLKGEDLSHFLNDALAQIGKEAEVTPSATAPTAKPSAAQGSGSLPAMPMVKLAVKEDIDEMFANDESLTEEFKERASTLFEAAVEARLNVEIVRVEEEAEAKLEEEVASLKEDLSTKIDQYLDYVVEKWIEENALAIESSLRSDITEDFMNKLRNLFSESYITVPEERIDVLGELTAEIEDLKGKLDESIDKQLELQAVIDEAQKEMTFDEVSEGLAATQVEKFRTLAEGVDFTDVDNYKKKLEIVKENYFSSKKATSTGIITEQADELEPTAAPVRADMAQYVTAISKTVK